MECRRCATPLDRPGDYCLVCDTSNADAVVVEAAPERAEVTAVRDGAALGTTAFTTTPESDPELVTVARRNFAGRIADETRRKRPEAVYVAGDHDVIRAVRADLHHDVYRVTGEEPVEEVLATRGERTLEVIEKPPVEKIGGSHTTLIGDRDGLHAIETAADHPNVKKLVPGPIDAGGAGSRGGLRAKATRADDGGNVRLLLRDGSSVQENRVVTTAMDREGGERVRADINEALAAEGFRDPDRNS